MHVCITDFFEIKSPDSTYWAAGFAIIVVHLVLAAFLFVAFSEDTTPQKED